MNKGGAPSVFRAVRMFLFLLFFWGHLWMWSRVAIGEDTEASAENYKSQAQRRPLFQPITALRCVLAEVTGVFGAISGHVQAATCPRVRLRVALVSSVSSSSAAPEATVPGLSGHVSGGPGHREPGDPGSEARRRPRLRAHAPGLLHDPGRDRVQHDSRR